MRNYASWNRGLDLDSYLKREKTVDIYEHAQNGKLRTWVLAPVDNPQTMDFFCACETFQRQALIHRSTSNGHRRVIAYGIAAVFCPQENRNKGYTTHMMRLLHYILAPVDTLDTFPTNWGSPPLQPSGLANASFSALWSVIGTEFYERLGWKAKEHVNTIWPCRETTEHLGRVTWLSEDDCEQLWEDDASYVEEKFLDSSRDESQTTCAFLPNNGLAAFQIRRVKTFLPGSPNLPIPTKWGVKLDDETEPAYATWITDINYSPASLTITRIRISEKAFPILLSAAMEAAKENGCNTVRIWSLDETLKKIAKTLGGSEEQDLECVPSLAWYEPEDTNDVKLFFNER
ncbi:hypothetical protein Clacol_000365 [Clathrus columnatus]|uniref:LYC1 C-terminal domain-containing protein n=1 Tax=Clathrus columnatus TaxID=1419009 RepID=A0AAV4ZZI1_9AGAM|nr:hypothetical protein Clacol_000365 [Clathrus columnatus]